MGKTLLSVGLDIGTTSTQMIVSELQIENRASAFSVPQLQIAQRRIRYQSPVYFTPLIHDSLVDGEAIRRLLSEEYAKAGICREHIDTGAIIVTGETSRKENAATAAASLSEFAGDFVVATAGPDLESRLAAHGSGAVAHSRQTGETVVHMDIGGGTSNLALIRDGRIEATCCFNVGGRLLKFSQDGSISYRSAVLQDRAEFSPGTTPGEAQLTQLTEALTSVLETAAALRPKNALWAQLQTREAAGSADDFREAVASLRAAGRITLSFSGGVAHCMAQTVPPLRFGDLGPLLAQSIRRSRLWDGNCRLGQDPIRATVIGAGSYATELSGSTIFYQNANFPLKNLQAVAQISQLTQLDTPGVLVLSETPDHYAGILALADRLAQQWPAQPVILAMEADLAKALGHALALRFPPEKSIICMDRVHLPENSFLDIGAPIASALPIVIKTLIFQN